MEAEAPFKEKLENYPSLFQTYKDFSSLTSNYLTKRLNVLENELKEEWMTQMQKCRIYNLISFIYFLLGQKDDALKNNTDSLEICPDNVIGLCNRGWFLLKYQHYGQIKQWFQNLERVKDNTAIMTIAKAEIAYAYSRLGIQFYSKAWDLFNKVISEAKFIADHDLPGSIELKENICDWSFRCALARTRLFRTYNVCTESDLEQSKVSVVSVCSLLKNIFQLNIQTPSCQILIPRAYVLLGEIANSIESKGILHEGLIQEVLDEDPELSVGDYYKKAFELQKDDTFVLDRCGMYYKLNGDLDRAIDVLKKSIEIKESSLNHHHLAVALKEKLLQKHCHVKRKDATRQLFEKKEKVTVESGGQHRDHGLRGEVLDDSKPNKEHKKKRLINSPMKIQYIDRFKHEKEVEEILHHLNKSFSLAMNTEVIYDKGLLYRHTGQLEDAIKEFRILTKHEVKGTSLVVLANSYEQIGYCLQDSIDRHKSQNPESDKEDMKMNFKLSLEISCEIVAKIPHLKDCWETVPTLQSLLERSATTKETLKDLDFLYDKMKEYDKHIDTLEQLLSTAETKEEQMECSLKIIQKHLDQKRFDDAVLSFEFIMCLPAWQELVDTELFVKVYIEGAYDSYRRGDEDIARLRFDDAFDFCHSKLRQSETTKLDTMKFNVLVLCNTNDEINGKKLLALLKHLGIKATLNTEGSYLFGRLDSECLIESLEQSNHVLVVYDFIQPGPVKDKELIRNVDIMYKIYSDRDHGNVRTIVPNETIRSKVPKTLPSQIDTFDFSFADHELCSKVESVKDILIILAIGDNK